MYIIYKEISIIGRIDYMVIYQNEKNELYYCLVDDILPSTTFFKKVFYNKWYTSDVKVGKSGLKNLEEIFRTESLDTEYLEEHFPHLLIIL